MKRARGGVMPEPPHVSGQGIHLPNPSYWPVVTALGILTFFVGLLLHVHVPTVLAGGAVTLFSILSWAFEPTGH
jgi:hypothetical protein